MSFRNYYFRNSGAAFFRDNLFCHKVNRDSKLFAYISRLGFFKHRLFMTTPSATYTSHCAPSVTGNGSRGGL